MEEARRSLASRRRLGACGEGAELKWGGRLLRNGARREYAIIFGRHGAGVGYVYARVDISWQTRRGSQRWLRPHRKEAEDN